MAQLQPFSAVAFPRIWKHPLPSLHIDTSFAIHGLSLCRQKAGYVVDFTVPMTREAAVKGVLQILDSTCQAKTVNEAILANVTIYPFITHLLYDIYHMQYIAVYLLF